MSILGWRQRKERRDYRRAVLGELQRTAQDTPGQMDGWDRRRWSDEELDRLGEQLGVPRTVPLPCRSAVEIRARVVMMLESARWLGTTPQGGSYTGGAEREMERLLSWIDGDDDDD